MLLGKNESSSFRGFVDKTDEFLDEGEIPAKNRKERILSNKFQKFFKTFEKAPTWQFSSVFNKEIIENSINFKLNTSSGIFFDVKIGEIPTCSCDYFTKPCRTKQVCLHNVWVLMNRFNGLMLTNKTKYLHKFHTPKVNYKNYFRKEKQLRFAVLQHRHLHQHRHHYQQHCFLNL